MACAKLPTPEAALLPEPESSELRTSPTSSAARRTTGRPQPQEGGWCAPAPALAPGPVCRVEGGHVPANFTPSAAPTTSGRAEVLPPLRSGRKCISSSTFPDAQKLLDCAFCWVKTKLHSYCLLTNARHCQLRQKFSPKPLPATCRAPHCLGPRGV